MEINASRKRALIISDLHIPYHHPDAFKFLAAIKDKYLEKNSVIINLGDELDKHAISFHQSDSELFSAGDELEKAKEIIHMKGGLHELFPKMNLCESNHGSLVYRKAKHHGIPLEYFRSYSEILETPKWAWHEDIVLKTKRGPVYITHGKSGIYGKLCKEEGMSCIQGHYHSKFEITWHKTKASERFNCFAGCLIDRQSMAFAYARNSIPKAVLGVAILSREGYPRLIKMDIKNNRWTGNLP